MSLNNENLNNSNENLNNDSYKGIEDFSIQNIGKNSSEDENLEVTYNENGEKRDKNTQYITIDDIKKHGKFFALKTPYKALKQAHTYNQYQKNQEKFLEDNPWWKENGKRPKLPSSLKAPEINQEKNPKDYKGLNDEKWGSALLCNRIEELDGYLTVIDINNEGEISLKSIEEAFSFIMDKTRVHKTGSGGYHIYLFSKEVPMLPQPSINIDYQKNGKYVIFDYRYSAYSDGKVIDLIDFIKEHYIELTNPNAKKSIEEFIESYKLGREKLEYNPINDMDILAVENSDDILEEGLNNLGLKPTKKIAIESDIHTIDFDDGDYTFEEKFLVEALAPFFTKGHFHHLGFYLAGFLYRNNYSEKFTKNLLNYFNEDGKGDMAIEEILDSVYRHGKHVKVPGWKALSEYINGYHLEEEKKDYLLGVLFKCFKRDITHPGNIYEYRNSEYGLKLLIEELEVCFDENSSDFESEKLLYYLYKKRITYKQIKVIFRALFGDKFWIRLKNVKKIFNERKSKLKANTILTHIVGEEKMKTIDEISPAKINYRLDVIKDKDYYFKKIQELNDDDVKIPPEVFQRYVELAYNLKVNETGTAVYKPTRRGYVEISSSEFSKTLVEDFGSISIPRDTIEKTFNNMNQILPVNYNVIHFKNGMLEIPERGTEPIFKEGKFLKDALPKISFPFG